MQCLENIGTQVIHQDHRSFHVYLSQCHLLHNLHFAKKFYIGEPLCDRFREHLRDVEKDNKTHLNRTEVNSE